MAVCADSLSLREFLDYGLSKNPPEHSTLSKTRKRLSLDAHATVFGWVLARLHRMKTSQGPDEIRTYVHGFLIAAGPNILSP